MIRFECDYAEGAHPKILSRLTETNMEQTAGYGLDPHCDRGRELLKELCHKPDADVHFLVGGTQTNTTVIASILRPHQGVIAADTGHINVHETGAIEATGHKVLTLPHQDGKITAQQIQTLYEMHWSDGNHEHMVQPGMVYLSFPTENGTIYSKVELEAIHRVCQNCNLPLFLDGARLGYGLQAATNDLTLPDIARLCDVFYLGGTKIGALFGEALMITNPKLKEDFRYGIKQHGGMLAKGRLLGIQFETLLEDGLYFEISQHAVDMAMKIKEAFAKKGYQFLYDSYTNQQFPIIPNEVLKKLSETYAYGFWETVGDTHTAVRFCTSWATKEEQVATLLKDIEEVS
ncbi:MAG: beta-eliminating lyase-related protein [Lachnospiraceae bacterium]